MAESFTPCRHAWWPSIAAGLSGEWSRESAMMDLRWHADETRVFGRPFPSRPTLSTRWGWTDKRVRLLLASPEWADPFNPTTLADLRGEPKGRSGADEGPTQGRHRADGERLEADTSPERADEGPTKGRSGADEGPHARVLHQHQPPTPSTMEDSAPVPGAAPSPEHSTASDNTPPPPSDEDYYASEGLPEDGLHDSGPEAQRSEPVRGADPRGTAAPSPTVGRVAAVDVARNTPVSADGAREVGESAHARRGEHVRDVAGVGLFAALTPPVVPEKGKRATLVVEAVAGKGDEVAAPAPPSPYHRAIEVFNEEHLSIIGTAYPWQFKGRDADGARVKSWLGTARVTVEDPDAGLMRLRGAVRAYLLAVEARTAWPIGEPAQTRHFTRDLPKWLQVDPSAAPQRPGNESKQSAALRALGKIDLSRFKKPPMEAP